MERKTEITIKKNNNNRLFQKSVEFSCEWGNQIENVDFRGVDLTGLNLQWGKFINCDFRDCNFDNCDLYWAEFYGCLFDNGCFDKAKNKEGLSIKK